MKQCRHCGQEKPLVDFRRDNNLLDGHRGTCKECAAIADRNYRKTITPERKASWTRAYRTKHADRIREQRRRWRIANREKFRAHNAVKRAIRDGLMLPGSCEVCEKRPAEAHHDDYAKWLDVRWLCPFHHHQEHKGANNGTM